MMITRRTVLENTMLAPLAAVLPACAHQSPGASSSSHPASPARSAYAPPPLPFDPTALPGLSEKLLRSHYENNYLGTVEKLDDVRERIAQLGPTAPGYVIHGLGQSELTFKNSVVLHELYFANLVGGGSKGSATQKLLSEHFGGAAAWEQRFRALGASLGGGSGWAVVEYDLHERMPRMYSAADHTQGLSSGVPLLVLDMYEHSYHMDYGTKADEYIAAFFVNLHWEEIDRRTELALRIAETLEDRPDPR